MPHFNPWNTFQHGIIFACHIRVGKLFGNANLVNHTPRKLSLPCPKKHYPPPALGISGARSLAQPKNFMVVWRLWKIHLNITTTLGKRFIALQLEFEIIKCPLDTPLPLATPLLKDQHSPLRLQSLQVLDRGLVVLWECFPNLPCFVPFPPCLKGFIVCLGWLFRLWVGVTFHPLEFIAL